MADYVAVGGIHDRGTIVSLNAYWKDVRHDYGVGGDLVYRGVHYEHKKATSDPFWEIWKYTWGADGITRIEGPLRGAWDDRATLDWA